MGHDTRCFFLAAAALLACAASAEAQFRARAPSPEDYHVELTLDSWKPAPEVRFGFDRSPEIDLIGLFDVAEKRFWDFRAVVKPARKHKIRLQHVDLEYEKDKTFRIDVSLLGRTLVIDLPASTSFKWDVWRIGYEWDFLAGGKGFIGAIGEVKYTHVVADISSTPFNLASSSDHTAPIPAVGLIGRAYISKNVSLTAEGTRFNLNRKGDDHAKFTDFDVFSTVNAGTHVGVQVGYRKMSIDYLLDDDSGELTMKGPYVGGSIRF